MVATFNETRAPTYRKNPAEQGIVMSNWSKTFQSFRPHSFVLVLEEEPNNLNFQGFFTSNRSFGGYFQWNACNYFQKRCSWAIYSDAKLIKNISDFLVALLRFCLSRQNKIFLPLIDPLVATFSETCVPTSRKYVAEQGMLMPNWSKIFQNFWSHSSLFALEKT